MIYFVEAVGLDRVKVGYASTEANMQCRVESIRLGCPVETRLLGTCDGDRVFEKSLHILWRDARVRGEWFELSDVASTIAEMATPWVQPACVRCGRPRNVTPGKRRPSLGCRACQRHGAIRKTPLQAKACDDCGRPVSTHKTARCQRCATKLTKPWAKRWPAKVGGLTV